MLLLCSNGLTSSSLLNELPKGSANSTASVVVTADNEYKERNYHVPRTIEALQSRGYKAETFDLDFQNVNALLNYDAVEFIGGNPYYLLDVLRKQNAKPVLQKLVAQKTLIGWSAGALVLSASIGIIDVFAPEMNRLGISDFTGMVLSDIQLVPHYRKFAKRYEQFEERCTQYEKKHNCKLIRLNDGEGIVVDGENRINFV